MDEIKSLPSEGSTSSASNCANKKLPNSGPSIKDIKIDKSESETMAHLIQGATLKERISFTEWAAYSHYSELLYRRY